MSTRFGRIGQNATPGRIAKSGLVGWRRTVADKAAQLVASRTKLNTDQARTLVGGLFFLLGVRYVVGTLNRALRGAR